jgi:NAD(P)-dependent dehydrogenase (short-subunit alcohol dehydrogenase family)
VSQVWLITGSSRGLGRHVVEAALDQGDRVLATARRPEVLEALVAAHSDRLRTIGHDVAVPVQATAAVQTALEAFGRLDVVVNNAGYADLASVEDMSETASAIRSKPCSSARCTRPRRHYRSFASRAAGTSST